MKSSAKISAEEIGRDRMEYTEITGNTRSVLYLGDCLEVYPKLVEQGILVDAVITDPPYGTTRAKHDIVIPLPDMWEMIHTINKENGAICLFCDGLYMADLMVSNRKNWKYNLVWDKELTSGFLNANKMPLRCHEEIAVFYKKQPTYNPQKVLGKPNHSKGKPKENENNNYNKYNFVDNSKELGDLKHPKSILKFQKPHPSVAVHPTQKSIELMEWLILSYTNEGDTVLDFSMGSGTTGIAALKLGRNFIGIEKKEEYYKVAVDRIKTEHDRLTNNNN